MSENYMNLIIAFVLTFFLSLGINMLIRFLSRKGILDKFFLSNLLTRNVRGGTPRAVGIAPFIALSLFLPNGYNILVFLIGIFALLDDIFGRTKIFNTSLEWGQMFRGIGIIIVAAIAFPAVGYASILIALMVQPLNISDMQPGSTCSTVIIMSTFVVLAMIMLEVPSNAITPVYFIPLTILVICLAYCPLDYGGKIMMGEVGNHSFAVALGISFYLLGNALWFNQLGLWAGFISTLVLLIIISALIAFIRRNNLRNFFRVRMNLTTPVFADFFMDVLTGGGLGDLIRKILLGKKQITVRNPFLMVLGFRRLLFNPYAPRIVTDAQRRTRAPSRNLNRN